MAQKVSIRAARTSDIPALSSICLLTGDAGVSAEANHNFPELLGLVYAVPYNQRSLRGTWGFVLVAELPEGEDEVVGYILGTTDTRGFEEDGPAFADRGEVRSHPVGEDVVEGHLRLTVGGAAVAGTGRAAQFIAIGVVDEDL